MSNQLITGLIRLAACILLALGVSSVLCDTIFRTGCLTGDGIPEFITIVIAMIVLDCNPRPQIDSTSERADKPIPIVRWSISATVLAVAILVNLLGLFPNAATVIGSMIGAR